MISMNLQNLRKAHRFTQEEVAEKANVSRQAVAKWENGETFPDINNCIALAQLYNVTLDNLVNDAEESGAPVIPQKGKHIFGTVTVGERGQIVIPKKARDVFKLKPDDNLIVLGDEDKGGLALIETDEFIRRYHEILASIVHPADGSKENHK